MSFYFTYVSESWFFFTVTFWSVSSGLSIFKFCVFNVCCRVLATLLDVTVFSHLTWIVIHFNLEIVIGFCFLNLGFCYFLYLSLSLAFCCLIVFYATFVLNVSFLLCFSFTNLVFYPFFILWLLLSGISDKKAKLKYLSISG